MAAGIPGIVLVAMGLRVSCAALRRSNQDRSTSSESSQHVHLVIHHASGGAAAIVCKIAGVQCYAIYGCALLQQPSSLLR